MAITEAQETLGARITGLRKDRGMTQQELAERLKVSQPVVSDYENDVIRIPADVVVELAKILNASTDEILGFKADIPRNGTIKNRRLLTRCKSSINSVNAIRKRCCAPLMPSCRRHEAQPHRNEVNHERRSD